MAKRCIVLVILLMLLISPAVFAQTNTTFSRFYNFIQEAVNEYIVGEDVGNLITGSVVDYNSTRFVTKEYVINPVILTADGYQTDLTPSAKLVFNLDDKQYELKIDTVYKDSVDIAISPGDIKSNLLIGQVKNFDLNSDSKDEITVEIKSIFVTKVRVFAKAIPKPVVNVTPAVKEEPKPEQNPVEPSTIVAEPKVEQPLNETKVPFYRQYNREIIGASAILALLLIAIAVFIPKKKSSAPVESQKQVSVETIRRSDVDHMTKLEIIMDHGRDMIKNKFKDEEIKAALINLNLSEMVANMIVNELKSDSGKIDELIAFKLTQERKSRIPEDIKADIIKGGWPKEIADLLFD